MLCLMVSNFNLSLLFDPSTGVNAQTVGITNIMAIIIVTSGGQTYWCNRRYDLWIANIID